MENTSLKTWESLYKKGRQGSYPNEMLIRFINSKFPRLQRDQKKILDLGYGTGRHLIYLAEENFDVYGIEYAESGVDIAKKWLAEKKLSAHLTTSSLLEQGDYGHELDAIIDIAAVQHNFESDLPFIINKVHQALKPGGYFFSVMKNRTDSLYKIGKKISDMTYRIDEDSDKVPNSFILSFPNKEQLINLYTQFSKVQIETETWTYANMEKCVSHWVVTAQK